MKKLRNIVRVSMLVVILALVTIVPVLAATSNWKFSMSTGGCEVNGKKNGVFHKLSKGKIAINGDIYTHSNANGNGSSTNYLNFALYNKTTGNYFGTVKAKPSGYAHGTKKISGTFSKAVGGGTKYYLVIYRGNGDGTKLSGSGKLKNK